MKDLWQICYLSESTRYIDQAEIENLLAKARKFNQANQISGMLLYTSGHFLQVLEGSLNTLDLLYEKICLDERHHEILKILEAPIERRYFEDWDMAYHGIEEFDLNIRDDIENFMVTQNKDTILHTPEQVRTLIDRISAAMPADQ